MTPGGGDSSDLPLKIWGYWHARNDPAAYCPTGPLRVIWTEDDDPPNLPAAPNGAPAGSPGKCPCGLSAEWLWVGRQDVNRAYYLPLLLRVGPFQGWRVDPFPFPREDGDAA